MAVTRLPGWEARLAAHVRAASGRPFVWGECDCCLWVCDAVHLMTGADPAAALRGRYRSERGALAALRRFAGGGLPETAERIAAELGCPEIEPRAARSGDVGLVPTEAGPALALAWGWGWVAKAPAGLVTMKLREAARAWRVG